MGNVLVLAEHRRGELRDITFEMLSLAPSLAKIGGEVNLLLGNDLTRWPRKLPL